MNRITPAIRHLEEHLSLVCSYWSQQKERGLGAVYLWLDGTLTYLTEEEIPEDTFGSLYAKLVTDNPKFYNPDWILVVVEVEDFPHPRFSQHLLAIDERRRIRTFNPIFGFKLQGTQTKVVVQVNQLIVEDQTPEGIESVSFFDNGGGV